MSRLTFLIIGFVLSSSFGFSLSAQKNGIAPKPLWDDPIYHGAADPVVIWNKKKKEWWMFYTNRRATIDDTTGVRWVHGTRIGVAVSKDGNNWRYLDTTNITPAPDFSAGFTSMKLATRSPKVEADSTA